MVAVTDGGRVGVDVERRDAAEFAGFESVVLHVDEEAPAEDARAITWTRKESLLKATGHGLSIDPRRIRLADPDAVPRLLAWEGPDRPHLEPWMHDLELGGHPGCVTVLSERTPLLEIESISVGQDG